jgi:putative nucleotidyltransferase with HDIG domain
MIPAKSECYRLMSQMGMLEHIARHSLQVCEVAMALADALPEGPRPRDRKLIQAAALLHDITKTRSFQSGENHAESGGRHLREIGFPGVGEIVRQHVRLDAYRWEGPVTETEIVNYADKRVLHDRIVGLQERMNYILDRYGGRIQERERIRWLIGRTRELEFKIFRNLPFTPDVMQRALGLERLQAAYRAYRKAAAGSRSTQAPRDIQI